MERYRTTTLPDGTRAVEVPLRGPQLLSNPMFNKSTAFSLEERRAFDVDGLLPHMVSTIEQQAERVWWNAQRKADPLERYIHLAAVQDRNETLFYRVLCDHLEELLPIVYTPTVGRACQEFSRIFRRARGLWIVPGHRGRIDDVLSHASFDDVRLIVVTDNEAILGLGDQGAGGMPIPVGKLALYTAAAGIHPAQTLPISLDVGTDNRMLLDDDLYLGWREPRLRGAAYDELVDELVQAVRKRFPRALLQWEDFRKGTAFALMERYRSTLPSFNDDIQGTAAVALAGLLTAARATGTALRDQRVVILGAGAAGGGIARLLRRALERAGLDADGVTSAVAVLDSHGLVVRGHGPHEPFRKGLEWPAELASARGLHPGADLLSVVRALRPTALIGVSGAAGAFNREVVTAAAEHVGRPAVLPLSNPTSLSEATPADVLAWTGGRALVATGSPFAPVVVDGVERRIGQGNNAFIFPGVGLGALLAEAREVTDGMFAAAAEELAAQVTAEDLALGALYPRIRDLRRVTAAVAASVVRAATSDGVAGRQVADAERVVADAMWKPVYEPFVPV